MATAPVKSQPLHNFSLPFLKWGKNQSSNHHHHNNHHHHHNNHQHSPSSLHHHHHNHNRSSASEPDSDGTASSLKDHYVGSRSTSKNLLIRFPKPPPTTTTTTTTGTGISTVKPVPTPDEEDSFPAAQPWNLRPRKTLIKAEIGGSAKSIHHHHHHHISSDFDVPEKLDKEGPGPAPAPGPGPGPGSGPKSMRLKAFAEAAQTVDKKDKSKLLVSLSREEIEEDFFVMTGSKPHRRPRKRPRCVQKQVDNLCPGLWLAGMTPESYNLPDFLLK